MPLYAYRCAGCGPFDCRREVDQAALPLPCPTCASPARRLYTPPGVRSRSGPLAGAGAAERSLVDRALTGEPTVTHRPSGRRLMNGGHRH
jgi:putative FmdB family regulatory protein